MTDTELTPDEPAGEACRAEIAARVVAIRAGGAVGRTLDDVLARLRRA